MVSPNEYESLLQVCKSRRSTRRFSDRLVSPQTIEKIKSVAMTSPYASGKKNWEIQVISDRGLINRMAQVVEDKVQKVSENIRPDMRDHFANYARNFTVFASAPVVFVPTFRAAPSLSLMLLAPMPEVATWERDNSVKSISCVSMLLLLSAESLQLGGCYVTGSLLAGEELASLISLPPGREIGAFVPVGYKEHEEHDDY